MSFPLLLDLFEAAELVGFSFSAVRHWTYGQRPAPTGWPKTVHVGRNVRYRRADLEEWVAGLGVQPTTPDELRREPVTTAPRRGRGRPRKTGGAGK